MKKVLKSSVRVHPEELSTGKVLLIFHKINKEYISTFVKGSSAPFISHFWITFSESLLPRKNSLRPRRWCFTLKSKSWLIDFEDNSHSFSTPNCKFALAITPQQLKCTLRLLSPFYKPKLEVIYWPEIVLYNSRYHSITVRPPQLYNFHNLSKFIFFRELRFHEKATPLIVSYIKNKFDPILNILS